MSKKRKKDADPAKSQQPNKKKKKELLVGKGVTMFWHDMPLLDAKTIELIQPKLADSQHKNEDYKKDDWVWIINIDKFKAKFRKEEKFKDIADGVKLGICLMQQELIKGVKQFYWQGTYPFKLGNSQENSCDEIFKRVTKAMGFRTSNPVFGTWEKKHHILLSYTSDVGEKAWALKDTLSNLLKHPTELKVAQVASFICGSPEVFFCQMVYSWLTTISGEKFSKRTAFPEKDDLVAASSARIDDRIYQELLARDERLNNKKDEKEFKKSRLGTQGFENYKFKSDKKSGIILKDQKNDKENQEDIKNTLISMKIQWEQNHKHLVNNGEHIHDLARLMKNHPEKFGEQIKKTFTEVMYPKLVSNTKHPIIQDKGEGNYGIIDRETDAKIGERIEEVLQALQVNRVSMQLDSSNGENVDDLKKLMENYPHNYGKKTKELFFLKIYPWYEKRREALRLQENKNPVLNTKFRGNIEKDYNIHLNTNGFFIEDQADIPMAIDSFLQQMSHNYTRNTGKHPRYQHVQDLAQLMTRQPNLFGEQVRTEFLTKIYPAFKDQEKKAITDDWNDFETSISNYPFNTDKKETLLETKVASPLMGSILSPVASLSPGTIDLLELQTGTTVAEQKKVLATYNSKNPKKQAALTKLRKIKEKRNAPVFPKTGLEKDIKKRFEKGDAPDKKHPSKKAPPKKKKKEIIPPSDDEDEFEIPPDKESPVDQEAVLGTLHKKADAIIASGRTINPKSGKPMSKGRALANQTAIDQYYDKMLALKKSVAQDRQNQRAGHGLTTNKQLKDKQKRQKVILIPNGQIGGSNSLRDVVPDGKGSDSPFPPDPIIHPPLPPPVLPPPPALNLNPAPDPLLGGANNPFDVPVDIKAQNCDKVLASIRRIACSNEPTKIAIQEILGCPDVPPPPPLPLGALAAPLLLGLGV